MKRTRNSLSLVLSSLAFSPACAVLAEKNLFLAFPYAAATVTAMAYHWHEERAFVTLDHGCAYSVIVANLWMLLHSSSLVYAMGASSLILLGLACYFRAHEHAYGRFHTAWHLLSGAGGFFLALSYR